MDPPRIIILRGGIYTLNLEWELREQNAKLRYRATHMAMQIALAKQNVRLSQRLY